MFLIIFFSLVLLFLLFFLFWLISMMVSSLTRAPYVATASNAFAKALELAKPQKGEVVYDLGCGDARVLRFAAFKYGTRGIGYEISPYCNLMSAIKNWHAGMGNKVQIRKESLLNADFENADVVYMYLTNSILDVIEKELFTQIKPSCRVVTIAFWFKHHQAVKTINVRQLGRDTKAYLYSREN